MLEQIISTIVGGIEKPAAVEPVKRYAYPYAKLGDFDLYVYVGEPVELKDGEALPDSSLPWKPQDAYGKQKIYFDGIGWSLCPDIESADLTTVKQTIGMRLAHEFNHAIEQLSAGYSMGEMKSWTQQVNEAANILSGATSADSPLLTALATARNVKVEDLAKKVSDKNAAYQKGYAQALADYQVQRDAVNAAESIAALSKVITILDVKHLPFIV